jgi:pimeloyl-ACP methyl ester carboxylesterase
MEEAGIQTAHHVGLSLGGMVAMTLALRRPARVDSLTLISTSAHPGGPELWCRRAATALDEGMRPLADEFTGRWFTPHWAATHQRVIRDLNSDIMKTEPKAFSALCGAIAAFNVADTLSSIAVKTQVIVGEDDKGTGPDHARRIAGAIPGADLHILPGSHLVNLESAQAVNDIVEEVLP